MLVSMHLTYAANGLHICFYFINSTHLAIFALYSSNIMQGIIQHTKIIQIPNQRKDFCQYGNNMAE